MVVADVDAARAREVAASIGERASRDLFDATNEPSVRLAVEMAVADFGRLDLLHNNAAMTSGLLFERDTDVVETPIEVWDAAYAVNLRGFVLGCKYAVPHLVANGGGVIVNMSSCAAYGGDVARSPTVRRRRPSSP